MAEARRDRDGRGPLQRPLRRGRRRRPGAAARTLARLRRAAGRGHVAGGDRCQRGRRDRRPRRLRQRPPARGRARGRAGRGRRAHRHRAAAAALDEGDLARVRGAARGRRGGSLARVIEAVLIGFAAGVVAGLLGVGGGALFVPALTIGVGLSQVDAEATSLLAIIPVALVAPLRQRANANLDLRTGAIVGLLRVAGAVGGAAIANAVPQRALEVSFALFMLFVAWRLARRALQA